MLPPWMDPEIANFRAITGLSWPTLFLAKVSILNTVHSSLASVNYFLQPKYFVDVSYSVVKSGEIKMSLDNTTCQAIKSVR